MVDESSRKIKIVESKYAITIDENGIATPLVHEVDESHPYFQWIDDDPNTFDHVKYAEILEYALGQDYFEKLFRPVIGPAYALKIEDLKACEERRLCHYSTRMDTEKKEKISYRVDFVADRWFCASTFAEQIISTYAHYCELKKPHEHIANLERQTRQLERQIPEKSKEGFTCSEIEMVILYEEKLAQLRTLQTARDVRGFAVTKGNHFAARACAYQMNHVTFCQFGDAEPLRNARGGKNSGRGLPSLTAKIINLLFDLTGMDRLTAKDVSQIYERGAPRVATFNSLLRQKRT